MILVVCVDDRYGMSFQGRRQSKDSVLRQELLALTKNSKLYMNSYSAMQFSEHQDQIFIDEAFMDAALPGEYCFVENQNILPYAGQIEGVILYRWNRTYPYDLQFPAELLSEGFYLESSMELEGSSHPCITKEVYCK